MAIIPSTYRILVRQENYEETDEVFRSAQRAGIEIIKDKAVRYQESVDVGVVIAVGPDVWSTFKGPGAVVGDKVVFAKHSGKKVEDPTDKNTHYVVLNDEDIVAVIKE